MSPGVGRRVFLGLRARGQPGLRGECILERVLRAQELAREERVRAVEHVERDVLERLVRRAEQARRGGICMV